MGVNRAVRGATAGTADQNIDLIGCEVDCPFARVQPKIHVRELSVELRHSLPEKPTCKGHGCIEDDSAWFLVGSQPGDSILQSPQDLAHGASKVFAGIREHDRSADPPE